MKRCSLKKIAILLQNVVFVVTLSLARVTVLMRGALGFSVLQFWPFFRSVFRFLHRKTSVFRFWCLLRFAVFPFFSIWFSVFGKNTSGFSDFVSDVVSVFPIWSYLVSGFSGRAPRGTHGTLTLH